MRIISSLRLRVDALKMNARMLPASLKSQRWGLLVTAAMFAIFASIYLVGSLIQHTESDGIYNWAYVRSIVIDHDIDFANDYALCGDPQGWSAFRPAGHPMNPSFVGPTLIMGPVLWIARLFPLAGASIDVKLACRGPYVGITLFTTVILGALTMYLAYRVARRFVSDGVAAFAIGIFGIGSSIAAYATVYTSYTHVYEAFAAALLTLLAVRASERPRLWRRWFAAGAGVALALHMRTNCAVLVCIPAALALNAFWYDLKGLLRAAFAIAIPVALLGILPLCFINKYLFNNYSVLAARDPYFLQFGHAHPFLLLFSPLGGLFLWMPVAWLSVWGAAIGLRRRRTRTLFLGILVSAAATTFISSAMIDWHGSGTFGARRLTVLVPLLALLALPALSMMADWLRRKSGRTSAALAVALMVPLALPYAGIMVSHIQQETWDRATTAGFYGRGPHSLWKNADEYVGDLPILPVEWLYALRYGVPPQTFRYAVFPWYSRASNVVASKPMFWKLEVPPLTDEHLVSRGFQRTDLGLEMWEKKATIVLGTEWPRATELRVTASATRPVGVRVGIGKAFGRVAWMGTLEIPGSEHPTPLTLRIPEGEFDSGINEFVFACDDPVGASVILRGWSLDDKTSYVAPYPGT